MNVPILRIWNEETQQYEGVPAIRGEPGPKGDPYVLTNADKQEIVAQVLESTSQQQKVTSYTKPTEIALKSGMQFICYCGSGGTFTFTLGNATFEWVAATSDDCGWFLWVQTSETAGSVILPGGKRTYLVTGGTVETVAVRFTEILPNSPYVVLTIG